MMLVALVAIVLTQRSLEHRGLGPQAAAVFGLSSPMPENGVRHARLISKLMWCETRVVELEMPGRFRLYETGSRWFIERSGHSQEVNAMAVEKWFGRHCSLNVEVAAPASTEPSPGLIVRFVNGKDETFEHTGTGIYRWMNRDFKSPELEAALGYLTELPPPSQPNQMPTEGGA